MSWDTFDREGQLSDLMGYDGNSLDTDYVGDSCYIDSDGKANRGAANQPLRGLIKKVDGNGDASVQVRGMAQFTYSGTAPTAGAYNLLECAASGAVAIDAVNGHSFFVDSVDTDESTCIVDLG